MFDFFKSRPVKTVEIISAEAAKRGIEIQIKLKKAQLASIAKTMQDNGEALDANRLSLLCQAMELYNTLIVLYPQFERDLPLGIVLDDAVVLRKHNKQPLKFEIN
jgi:BioD-like phosphotransacetylase family protein